MASYGYPSRGKSFYNDLEPKTNYSWGNTGYAPEHVCKPVVVDADGKKHPIVSYNPGSIPETHIIETQTIVTQQVHSPFVDEYKHSSPRHEREREREHGHGHGHVENKLHVPGRNKWHGSSSPDHERSHKVKDFITKVQTEASGPKRFGLLSPSLWRRSPDSAGHHGHGHGHGNNGYGDYHDKSSKDWHKPNGHTIQNTDHGNYYHNNDSRMEPTVVTSGGWERPSRTGWAVPPDTSLSRPTNDIGTAVEYLKEAARPTLVTTYPHSRVTAPVTTGPRRDDYGQIIDSREAAKRYGNLRPSPVAEERYTGTIDSREAARKYRGAAV